MKISAVIISRNDNYGGNLLERATYCINSAIDTYDEVFYIDWNSPTHSLLYNIKDNLNFKGNLKHIVISPEIASILTNNDPHAQVCCETLARNLGLRRAEGDWIVSTNIDVIQPRRDYLEELIISIDSNTFYTISRRPVELEDIKKFHNGECKYEDWKSLREYLIENSEERHYEEKVNEGDDYSIINCCGDFQLANRHVWNEIRGFEEDLIYVLYSDTNVQKKAVMHGFGLKALYNPALFHINHGRGGGGFLDGINKVTNDHYRAIISQQKTQNSNSWGFGDTEIEFEIF
jgi:hypothetical protein